MSSEFAQRQADIEKLKRKKDGEEKERIRKQLEEDKRERAERQQQAQLAKQ